MQNKNKFGPRCPNHGVHLVDCKAGYGICPVSSCVFQYDEEHAKKN